jgi:DNA-binding transcriptional MocR family regulator
VEWKPNPTLEKPLYKQIAEHIERRIAYREFPPGSLLPSERALAKELRVNRSTIAAAYDELRAAGLIESKKGSGTRVSTDIWGMASKRIPNWGKYVESRGLFPNLPLVRRILKETRRNDLIDMASGELSPDLFPNDIFRTYLSQHDFTAYLGYEDAQGHLPLRETIASHVKSYKNIDATASSILITSGAQQALYLIVQCLLNPGDAVAIEDPSYCYSLPFLKSAGIRTFLLPVDKHGMNPDDLVSLHRKHRIRMVFLNPNFQNPTGTVLDQERRNKILELSYEFGIPIVEDDPYSLIPFTEEKVFPLKSRDQNGNVLYISSLTKIVASGLRIGWIIGPQAIIERLADAKQQVDFGHSILPQWLANQFLASDQFDSHISRLRQELKQKRDRIVSSLRELLPHQVEFLAPEGGIHMWCKLKEPVNEYQLFEAGIRRGVVFVPGSVYGSKQGYVRFTFGRTPTHLIHEGISRFSDALRDILDDKSRILHSTC